MLGFWQDWGALAVDGVHRAEVGFAVRQVSGPVAPVVINADGDAGQRIHQPHSCKVGGLGPLVAAVRVNAGL